MSYLTCRSYKSVAFNYTINKILFCIVCIDLLRTSLFSEINGSQ